MPATTQVRITAPRAPAVLHDRVVDVVVETEEKLLLNVVEAARRLGIGRTLMYELIAAGAIESVHVGRLRKIPVRALDAYVAALRAGGSPPPAAR